MFEMLNLKMVRYKKLGYFEIVKTCQKYEIFVGFFALLCETVNWT